ncbi:hypothetical protein [Streptomyces sp. AC550_RSS872]|uniref:hypothetical protein n=1 Tax=Streptomyces sp. AC550_RSS872 TaxID=2823689 RepID=UPI001C2518E6|nr:hypothetical protein [Streptomyces sp. AC550_RSS872]
MGWTTEQFHKTHEGRAAAVLADGSEPKPMLFDSGSGANFHETSDWWVYDGESRAPLATDLRGACSCGWRGTTLHPIDWSRVERDHVYVHVPDSPGPHRDWAEHIREVEARAVPLPEDLADLLERLDERLSTLADDAPVAALKAVARLERITLRISREATYNVDTDEVSWDTIGTALGTSADEARSRLFGYSRRR